MELIILTEDLSARWRITGHIYDILYNQAIIVPIIAWFAAQVLKVFFVLIFQNKFSYSRLIGSGGMPSSHSAFIVSLAVTIGKVSGWDSPLFGMAVAVSLIVMYDAAGVRRAAGKHAEVLNKLILSLNDKHFNEELKELLGHSPLEVIAGAALGIVTGLILG